MLKSLIITPAIKHVNKFCGMPVFPENGNHALIYLVAGVISLSTIFHGYGGVSFRTETPGFNDPPS